MSVKLCRRQGEGSGASSFVDDVSRQPTLVGESDFSLKKWSNGKTAGTCSFFLDMLQVIRLSCRNPSFQQLKGRPKSGSFYLQTPRDLPPPPPPETLQQSEKK